MKEIWKDIKGYESLYQISNYGRVKSLNYKRTCKEIILKQHRESKNHLFVSLWKDTSFKRFKIHRLVAEAFISNPNNYEIVHHIDHNPENNRVDNLVWMDKREHQALHNVEGKSKTVYQYTLEGELIAVWKSASEAAKQLKYTISNICDCCVGKRFDKSRGKWVKRIQYKGYKWSYIPL